jgi:hypothetical protein
LKVATHYVLLCTAVNEQAPSAMHNKKALLTQGFQTLGGRWDVPLSNKPNL